MRQVVLIPWRGGEQARERALRYVWENQWSRIALPVYTGDSGEAKFNRGASRNAAAKAAGQWDVAIFADADVLIPGGNIRRALEAAYLEDVVVFPHDRYHALDEVGRPRVMTTHPSNGSGAFAISWEAWRYVQGFDSRLVGWGYEDAAFYIATTTLLGKPIRMPGALRELWHPKTGRGRPPESQRLLDRYKAARGDPARMLEIVNEDPLE